MKALVLSSILSLISFAAHAEVQDVASKLNSFSCGPFELLRMSDEDGQLTKLVLANPTGGARLAVKSVTYDATTSNLTLVASDNQSIQYTYSSTISTKPGVQYVVTDLSNAAGEEIGVGCKIDISLQK